MDRDEIPSCGLLLDLRGYVAYRRNSTTACSTTSTGLPIAVSLCAARPPSVSHIAVHCPGLEELDDKSLPPKVVSSDGDLILLRVPLSSLARTHQMYSDHFVYRMDPHHPKLDLLRKPWPTRFGDNNLGILSCGGGDGDGRYVVAGLKIQPFRPHTFNLHVYRSGAADGDGRWTSLLVSVEAPLRDSVCPIPESAEQRMMYHLTDKVIVVGGDRGLIGWVDLWRGILLCDVLSETPKLRDIPLLPPAKGNRDSFLNSSPYFSRSIAVNQRKDTIKYVEMEITLPTKPGMYTPGEQISFYQWVHSHHQESTTGPSYALDPGSWTATTYSMPVPDASWEWDGWSRDCTLRLADLKVPVGNPRHSRLLHRLMSSKEEELEAATNLSLGNVSMAYPSLTSSDDGDTIYLVSKVQTGMEAVLAVGVREAAVLGMAKLDTQRHVNFRRCFLATGIKHTKIEGTRASFTKAEEYTQNLANRRHMKSCMAYEALGLGVAGEGQCA